MVTSNLSTPSLWSFNTYKKIFEASSQAEMWNLCHHIPLLPYEAHNEEFKIEEVKLDDFSFMNVNLLYTVATAI